MSLPLPDDATIGELLDIYAAAVRGGHATLAAEARARLEAEPEALPLPHALGRMSDAELQRYADRLSFRRWRPADDDARAREIVACLLPGDHLGEVPPALTAADVESAMGALCEAVERRNGTTP